MPDLDLSHLQLSSNISESVKKDLEQIAVVILLGHDILKKCGVLVGKGKSLVFFPYQLCVSNFIFRCVSASSCMYYATFMYSFFMCFVKRSCLYILCGPVLTS